MHRGGRAHITKMITLTFDRGTLALRMPYEPTCIAQFKAVIPAKARKWDEESKTWFFMACYLPQLVRVLRAHFADEEIFIDSSVPRYICLKNLITDPIQQNNKGSN
jgi:hypothetical protein